ncbi:MAG: D-alanyl-D-alanine carboxypeptidase [Ruminococcus sp.]|nr:D-alanyl-D-alanine carboxypeptidase [Ruminococcus sp.]
MIKSMIRRYTAVLLAILTVIMSGTVRVQAEENAAAYILTEACTGAVLEEYNSDQRLNAGYLSKLMSLLLIAEDIETGKFSLETELTAPQSVYGTKGAVIWLEPGDKLTVDELLKGAVIGNANDAVTVLAERSEGSLEKFTARMNSEAFDLGLRDTAFYSPHGYYDEREYTTAHDLAVICSELLKYEFMEPYFRTWRDFIKEGQTELVNENTLARTYDRHVGFKASHSEESGYCIAECGRSEDGTAFIAIVLGASDENSSLSQAKQLVKKGFSDYKVTTPGFLDELLRPVKVKNGVDSAVEVRLKSQSTVVVPKGVSELSNVIVMPEYLEAPLKKGQKAGTAAFYNGDTLVYETDIIVQNDVKRLTYSYILKKMLLNLIEN